MTNDILIANSPKEDPFVFEGRFSRSYRLLHFIAGRVLGGTERAEEAVDNCWITASRNPPRFFYEGEFRSWLLRVLIDEALAILRRNQEEVAQGKIGFRRNSFAVRDQLHEKRITPLKAAAETEY
jgi:DNA-directed RNA polymerase specialized sigma24 family protein